MNPMRPRSLAADLVRGAVPVLLVVSWIAFVWTTTFERAVPPGWAA